MSRLDATVEPTQKDTGLGWTHGLSRLKKTRIRLDAHGLSRLNTCYIIKRQIALCHIVGVEVNLSFWYSFHSGPKLLFSCKGHPAAAFRTSMPVPLTDSSTTAIEAQPPHCTAEWGGHIANDATHHDMLYAMAVGAVHGDDFLPEQSAAFIIIALITTGAAPVFLFPCHCLTGITSSVRHDDGLSLFFMDIKKPCR